MEPIKLHFAPTVNDFIRVTRRLQLESARRPGAIVAWVVVAAVFIWMVASTPTSRSDFPFIVALPLILVVVIIWLGPWMGAQRVGKVIKAAGDVTYEFSDDHVIIKDATGELKQEWSAYNRVIVTREYYILIIALNRSNGRFVPRRAFESPEQETAFRELLGRKLNFKG